MDNLKNRIYNLDKLNSEEVKTLISDIMNMTHKEDIREMLLYFLTTFHDVLLDKVLDDLLSKENVESAINKLKIEFKNLTGYSYYDVENLFVEAGIHDIYDDILIQVDNEIGSIERKMEDSINKAQENGISVEQWINSEIKRLEKEKSNEIKDCNEQIEAVKLEIGDRELFGRVEELKTKISELKAEQNEIVIRSGEYPTVEDEKRFHEILDIIKDYEQEIAYRELYASKSVEELSNELVSITNEQAELYRQSIISGEELSAVDRARYEEISELIKYINLELIIKEKTKFDSYSDEDLEKLVFDYEQERNELYRLSMESGEALSEKDEKRYHELNDLLSSFKPELENRKNNKFRKVSSEDLNKLISDFENEQREIVARSGGYPSDEDEKRYHDINKKVSELKLELDKRKKDPVRAYSSMSKEDLARELVNLQNKQKGAQSVTDKRVEDLKDQIRDAKRLEDLNKYKKNFQAKNVENKENRKDLWYKGIAAASGVVAGLALSSVPGVGTIRMVVAGTKLAHSGINMLTKKHPEGKVAKIVSTVKDKTNNVYDKFDNKFGDKIVSYKEKHPKVVAFAKLSRDRLKRLLASDKFNCFVNGVAAGYLAGNIIEGLTGETVGQHLGNMFDGDKTNVVVNAVNTVETGPTEVINTEVVPTETLPPVETVPEVIAPTVEETISATDVVTETVTQVENVASNITLEPGATYDLSGLARGYVSYDAPNSVSLITEAADDVVFDRIVGDRVHFIQSNGQGMAWYDLKEVQEYLAKASEMVSNASKVK